ncbi:hypothetical protein QFZ91_004835 [Paraburkholderia sp. JPY419]
MLQHYHPAADARPTDRAEHRPSELARRRSGSTQPASVWFAYSPNRQGIHPQTHLANFKGILQADAYAGFDELFRDGSIREAACHAHARRKFYDIHVRTPSDTTQKALEYIGGLYDIEASIRGRPAAERLRIRQENGKRLSWAVRPFAVRVKHDGELELPVR